MATNLNKYIISYKNSQTQFPISNNSKVSGIFPLEVMVSKDGTTANAGVLDPDVIINYVLRINDVTEPEATYTDNPFVHNVTKVGKYRLTTTITSGGITKTFEFLFSVEESYTSLTNYKNVIVNRNTGLTIVENSVILTSIGAVPILQSDLPVDLEIDNYTLLRNGLKVLYNPNYDNLQDIGSYELSINVRRKEGYPAGDLPNKEFKTKFSIEHDELVLPELPIEIINGLNNVEIPDNRIFINEPVIIDYSTPEKVIITPTLTFYNDARQMDDEYLDKMEGMVIGDFEKGFSLYESYGVYKLTLVLVEEGNEKNTYTLTRKFSILRDILTLTVDKILFKDGITELDFNSGHIFYTREGMIPLGYYNAFTDERTEVNTSLIRKNPEKPSEWDTIPHINGETKINESGEYKLTFEIYEINNELNSISKSITFDIIDSPLEINEDEIILKNSVTGESVLNGAVYPIVNGEHPFLPSWNNTRGCTTECNFKISGSQVDYRISNIEEFLTYFPKPVDGEYVFNLKVKDNNYPSTNFVSKWFVFNIVTGNINSAADENYMIYINGIQHQLNSKGYYLDKPGNYNVVAVKKNPHNFKYTVSEVNFKIISDKMAQKALIYSEPPQDVLTNTLKVFIEYPEYALEREYSINNGTPKRYEGRETTGIPQTDIANGNFIVATYRDPYNNGIIKSTRFDIGNLDNTATEFSKDDIIGIKDGGSYYSVTPSVKKKFNFTYKTTLRRGKRGEAMKEIEGYKLGQSIKAIINQVDDCVLEIEANNNNTLGEPNLEIINFTLDGVRPKTIVLGGFRNNEIQESAKPEIVNSSDFPKGQYRIEAYLNNRPLLMFHDGTKYTTNENITRQGNYKLSVSVVNLNNGLRTISVGHFVINNSTIINGRLAILPLQSKNINKVQPYDGELILINDDKNILTGDVGIYRDGSILNKVRDLRVDISKIKEDITEIEADMVCNRSRSQSLVFIKDELFNIIEGLNKQTRKILIDVEVYNNLVEDLEVPSLDDVINDRPETDEALTQSKLNNRELNQLLNKISKKPLDVMRIIENYQYNSNYIGEVKFLTNLYKAKQN